MMRFFIWNKEKKFDATSKETIAVSEDIDGWTKHVYTYGAEVIDPLNGEKSAIYDSSLKTMVMIHGFNANIPKGGISEFMNAHTEKGDYDDYNFLAVDWHLLAEFQNF